MAEAVASDGVTCDIVLNCSSADRLDHFAKVMLKLRFEGNARILG
jgi:hypothetical protein